MKKIIIFFAVLFHSILVANDAYLTQEERSLIEHVNRCIELGERQISKLNNEALNVPGGTSNKIRHFLNNLCSRPNTHYLEIGMYKGATFISSLFENSNSISSAIGIDNWSEFGGPKEEFHQNCNQFLSPNSFSFIEANAFSINTKEVIKDPINIYFYDGFHSMEDQMLAITYYDNVLADPCIIVIDDWNYQNASLGTKVAFRELHYQVLFEKELPAIVPPYFDLERWWNGLYVAVIRKTTQIDN